MKEKTLFTEKLGLFGWEGLEPVILGALANEAPMLLIGRHGSAKSYILEKLAEQLKLDFRSYNASLINYDDLVGFPIPVNNNTELSYISNPCSIWDAEAVFLDEINRTKPELQNKLFPIVYEKRVQGVPLKKLKYRWAAMNPPMNEEDSSDVDYLGTVPLDPALADRFPFVINVPDYDSVSRYNQKMMLLDAYSNDVKKCELKDLIKETKEEYNKLIKDQDHIVIDYIIQLTKLIRKSIGYISLRRETMLLDTFYAIHAARIVIERHKGNETAEISDTALIHIQYSLSDIALKKIELVKLIAIAKEALSLVKIKDSSKDILNEDDDTERLIQLIKGKDTLERDFFNDTLISSFSKLKPMEKRAMGLALYLSLRGMTSIPASTMETITNEVKPIYKFNSKENSSVPITACFNKVQTYCAYFSEKTYKDGQLIRNLLNSFLGEYPDTSDVDELANYIKKVWKGLGR